MKLIDALKELREELAKVGINHMVPVHAIKNGKALFRQPRYWVMLKVVIIALEGDDSEVANMNFEMDKFHPWTVTAKGPDGTEIQYSINLPDTESTSRLKGIFS